MICRKLPYALILIYHLMGQQPANLDSVIYIQMLQLKSKLDINPIIWQDTREGYLRNRALRVCDMAIDKLGKMNSDSLISKYYTELDSLMIKINDGKEFEVYSPPKKNYHINFFYSSSRP